MGLDLLAETVRDLRGSVLGWVLGLGAYGGLVTASFPSVRDNEAVEAYLETLPEAMLAFFGGADLTTAAGFFRAELFSYLPALLAVFTVGKAIQLTVGEEQAGTMDLVLAQPVPRWRVVVERFAGLALATGLVVTGLTFVLALSGALVGLGLGEILGLAAWCYLAGLASLVFGSAALAAAGFAHQSRGPLVAGSLLAAGGFLVDGLGRLVETLDRLGQANPYRWYGLTNPVAGEVSIAGLAGLVLLLASFVALAAWGYERKDISV